MACHRSNRAQGGAAVEGGPACAEAPLLGRRVPPHAVDKPPHVGRPGSRRPGQDDARGDEFACAVPALIAIGSPAAVAEEAMPDIEVRCALSAGRAALSDNEQSGRTSTRALVVACILPSRRGDPATGRPVDYDSGRPPTAAGEAAPWPLRLRCPAGGPIDRSYSASGTP
jgi:hypothetical protein